MIKHFVNEFIWMKFTGTTNFFKSKFVMILMTELYVCLSNSFAWSHFLLVINEYIFMYLGAWQMTIQIPLWLKRGLGLSRKKWWLGYKNTGTYNSIQLHSKISSFDNFVTCIHFNLTGEWKIKIMADSFYRIVQRLFGKFIRYSFKLLIYLLYHIWFVW